MGGQKREEAKPTEVKGEEEWEVEKILNKRKVRGIEKYLVRWKRFMVEHDIREKKEDLVNTKEAVDEFERKIGTEVRRQEEVGKWSQRTKKEKRIELPERYTAKLLYRWDNGKFEEKSI